MNIFEVFGKDEYKNTTIMKYKNRMYTIEDIRDFVAPLYKSLIKSDKKIAAIISKNNFDFYINFLAAVFAQKEIFLVTDTNKHLLSPKDSILLDKITDKDKDRIDYQADIENTFINLFTSGSGSSPKRVKKSLKNLILETESCYKIFENYFNKPADVVSSTLPHHMFGIIYYMMLSMCACNSIIFDAQEILYPDSADLGDKIFISTPSFLEKFQKHNVRISNLVPQLPPAQRSRHLLTFSNDTQKFCSRSLSQNFLGQSSAPRIIFSAGDKLKESVSDFFSAQNIKIIDIYGSTETGTIAYKNAQETEYNCFGDVKISTDDNSQATIKSSYFLEDSIVIADIIEQISPEKFILKCRNDRTVKIQEKRISLPEIEADIISLPLIKDAYCFKSSEKLACAAVLTEEGQKICIADPVGLTKQLKMQLNNKTEIVPQKWRFLYEIPKTRTGKTDRQKAEKFFSTNITLPLIIDKVRKENEFLYKLVFLKNSNFFKGHFDKMPILPGVVQLYSAHYIAQCAFGENIPESPAKKIKFSHIIKPSDVISLELKKTDTSVSFCYKKEDKVCSSGVFSLEKK